MIEICSTSVFRPLRLIFNHSFENGIHPCEWEKDNVVSIHLKGGKQTLKSYGPVHYFQFAVKFLKDSYIRRCLVLDVWRD